MSGLVPLFLAALEGNVDRRLRTNKEGAVPVGEGGTGQAHGLGHDSWLALLELELEIVSYQEARGGRGLLQGGRQGVGKG